MLLYQAILLILLISIFILVFISFIMIDFINYKKEIKKIKLEFKWSNYSYKQFKKIMKLTRIISMENKIDFIEVKISNHPYIYTIHLYKNKLYNETSKKDDEKVYFTPYYLIFNYLDYIKYRIFVKRINIDKYNEFKTIKLNKIGSIPQ